ncbi:hypothetical protein ElyMa_002723300 [Elysia marginata]|uniref:Ig-like domain-containing protein n=1 Tax=Elysia marginata TaxID=1093978 RepID=A0AAV4HEG4_9GAST|nr:hypothetical protein ElyMa_002723300 [Elysia marginata]
MITKTPYYRHTETDESPVYYRSQCSVSVSVEELGEGTHSFQGYIYPDVTGGENLGNATLPNTTVELSMPQASHSCSPDPIDGIFSENGTRCNCSLTSDGYPSGLALWYQDDEIQTLDSDGLLVLTKENNSGQVYTCETVSVLGRKVGSTLNANFAVKLAVRAASPTTAPQRDNFVYWVVLAVVCGTMAALCIATGLAVFLVNRGLNQLNEDTGHLGEPSIPTDRYMSSIPMETTGDKSSVDVKPEGNQYDALPGAAFSTFKPAQTPDGSDKLEDSSPQEAGDNETRC